MKNSLLILFLAIGSTIFAQKAEVKLGSPKILKGQTEVRVLFDYSALTLTSDSISEDEYIRNRIVKMNEKNPGNGTVWKEKWIGAKEYIWEPKFMELLSKYATKNSKILFSENATQAPYTMIVKVDWLYAGWDAGIMKQPAKVSTTISIIDSNNMDDKKFIIKYKDAPGNQFGNNFSDESRLGEGFAKTAKTFSKFLEKELK